MTDHSAPSPSRRAFLQRAGRAAGCGALLPIALRCSSEPGEHGRRLLFSLDKLPHLAVLRGLAAVMVDGRRLLLIRATESSVVALDGYCTHVLCDLSPEVDGTWDGLLITCTCHGSQFDIDGAAVKEPALLPLARFPTTFDAEAGTGIVELDQPSVPLP